MHDQFMGMNTIQQLFLSRLPAFYALAIPMSTCLSNLKVKPPLLVSCIEYWVRVIYFLIMLSSVP